MRELFALVLIVMALKPEAQVLSVNSLQLVNSSGDEQNPVVAADGKTLYFTIANHPQNIGGKKDPGDIWFSRWMGDQWSAPVHAGSLLNDRGYNAVAGVSFNGEQLFLHGHYDPAGGTARTQGISISSNTGNGWSRPANISIPYFQNKSGMISGTVTGDGHIFIFSAETYGTHGVEDIYVCKNTNGKWTEPRNLGATINTQFQEVSPSVSADGKTIYFSSNGRKGKGSFDVYASTRMDDTWMNWSAPVNLDNNVNTSGRELYFRPYVQLGYAIFTSTVNSDGYGDIRMHHYSQLFPKPDSVMAVADPQKREDTLRIVEVRNHIAGYTGPERLTVYGRVLNSKTGEPVQARVAFVSQGRDVQTTQSSANGYRISISPADQYSITIEAHGYISTMEKLDIDTPEMQELEMNFSLQPVVVGTVVNLKSVLFQQAKTDILPESYPELDLVVKFMQDNPTVRIELSGHTDNRGVHADNVKLSQQRVNKVKAYLVSKGVDTKRISGKGYGGTRPIASNETEESRRMNRRVEFTIKRS